MKTFSIFIEIFLLISAFIIIFKVTAIAEENNMNIKFSDQTAGIITYIDGQAEIFQKDWQKPEKGSSLYYGNKVKHRDIRENKNNYLQRFNNCPRAGK